MKTIDLSVHYSADMFVYPGDPKPVFEQIQTVENDDWNMIRFSVNGHDGTHVNVPYHCSNNGKTLSNYTLDDFIGESVIFESEKDIIPDKGVFFINEIIDIKMAKLIAQKQPKFVGLSSKFEWDIEAERFLLDQGIISFERVANLEKLPKNFFFHGAPLKIPDGDGSPVRAYAII